MKQLLKPLLMTVALIAVMAAGCGQRSKVDDVTQNEQQSAAPQPANNAGKMVNTTVGAIDDSMITTKVTAAIVAEPTLSALNIKVNTADGVVTLSGMIDSPDKAERARQLAQTVDGVKTINNELVVKSSS